MVDNTLLGYEGKRRAVNDPSPRLFYNGGLSQRGYVETTLQPRLHFSSPTATTMLDPDVIAKQDRLIVETRVREILPEGFRVSPEFLDALNRELQEIVVQAVERAKANDRKTLMPQDV